MRKAKEMNSKRQSKRRPAMAGFSMVELAIVVSISLVLAGFAIPLVRQTVFRYRLGGAVSSVTAAIRTGRYLALMKGYRYRLAISPTNRNYQFSSDPERDDTFASDGNAVPFTSPSAPVTISAATTLEFRPNGQVAATAGGMSLDVSYQGVTKTITVSTYGNVTVTP
jgi:Tfp pilus assembly protein FimT